MLKIDKVMKRQFVSFLLMVISLIIVPVITVEAVIAPADYVIYKDGTTIYAQNGQTGVNDYSGTDASTVIQSAINALTNGGKIFIKKGTYLISAHSLPYTRYPNMFYGIYLRDNILIAGEGRDTILKANSMPNVVIVNEQYALNGLSKNYNIEICDIAIQGYSPTGGTFTPFDEAIRITNIENLTVERVYVSDFNGGAVNFCGSEDYQSVYPNKPVSSNIVVRNSEVINCQAGIQTTNGAKTVRYFNNYLYKMYDTALSVLAAGLWIEDVKIEGNVVDNPLYSFLGQGSIEIKGENGDRWCSKVSIENNYVGNLWVGLPGIDVANADRVVISGNILNRIGPEGIMLQATRSKDAYNFLVTDNLIFEAGLNSGAGGATQSGIVIGAGLNCTIGNILVSGNKIDGATTKKGIYEKYIAGDASWGGTITNTQYVGNQVILMTGGITGRDEFDIFQGNPIYKSGNRGRFYKEDNRGTASVTGAVTTVTVTHGLAGVPTTVAVAPRQQGSGKWSVTSRDATNFVITFATAPNANTWYFDWYAEYKP